MMARYHDTSEKPRIFWAPSEDKYAAKIPGYGGQAFLNDWNLMVMDAVWKPKEKLWLFGEDSLKDAIDVIILHFRKQPEVEYKPKPTAETFSPHELNGANAAALAMFKAAGYDTSKKVYSMLITQFHPDKPTGDKDKAAAITVGWREVKKALGWS